MEARFYGMPLLSAKCSRLPTPYENEIETTERFLFSVFPVSAVSLVHMNVMFLAWLVRTAGFSTGCSLRCYWLAMFFQHFSDQLALRDLPVAAWHGARKLVLAFSW